MKDKLTKEEFAFLESIDPILLQQYLDELKSSIQSYGELSIFEEFRKKYPGVKRGSDVEFENFKKKNKEHKLIAFTLLDALEKEIAYRGFKKSKGEFIPEWKNLSTWINNKCWTVEYPEIKVDKKEEPSVSYNTIFNNGSH